MAEDEQNEMKRSECRVCCSSKDVCFHYGVQTCKSCMQFFKARCLAPTFSYDCDSPSVCPMIKTEMRKHLCRHCRFLWCLRLGMDPDLDNRGWMDREPAKPRNINKHDKRKAEECRMECQAKFLKRMEKKPRHLGGMKDNPTCGHSQDLLDQPTASATPQASDSPNPSPQPSPAPELDESPQNPFFGYTDPHGEQQYPPKQPTTSTFTKEHPSPHLSLQPDPSMQLALENAPENFLGWIDDDLPCGQSHPPSDQPTTSSAPQASSPLLPSSLPSTSPMLAGYSQEEEEPPARRQRIE